MCIHDKKVRCALVTGTLQRGHVPPWQRSFARALPARVLHYFSVQGAQVAMCPQGSKRVVRCLSMHTLQLYKTGFASCSEAGLSAISEGILLFSCWRMPLSTSKLFSLAMFCASTISDSSLAFVSACSFSSSLLMFSLMLEKDSSTRAPTLLPGFVRPVGITWAHADALAIDVSSSGVRTSGLDTK